jgi:serine/threonine-protein kinase
MIGNVLHEQYRIQKLLGEGGMGVVYQALDLELDRPVALKLLKGEFTDNEILVKRFRDELKVLASFNHPNITMLYTSFSWEGRPAMVMELLDGQTLSRMIGQRGPIPQHICVPMVTQALAGVGEAHRRSIIHRDLKPANLMLCKSGVVKVMDFGIAKIEQAPGLTRTTTVMGTPYYMAPEQVDPGRFGMSRVDARADIYAMGITLYELLAGEVPFRGATEFSIQRAHLEQAPQPPTVYYPHIAPAVVEAVLRAIAKDPRDRFQSAEEFADALEKAQVSALDYNERAASSPLPQPAPTVIERDTAAGEESYSVHEMPSRSVPGRLAATSAAPPISSDEAELGIAQTMFESGQGKTTRTPDSTPHPIQRPAAAAVAMLILLLSAGGIALYLHQGKAPAVLESERSIGGGGGGSNGGSVDENSSLVVKPTPANRNPDGQFQAPYSKPVDAHAVGITVPVPDFRTKSAPVQEIKPVPAKKPEGVLAGRWSGSYTSCEDSKVSRANIRLSEGAGKDAGSLIVTGSLVVSSGGAAQSCSLRGTFMGSRNRLALKAACGFAGAPEYLSASHTSVLSLRNGQLSGMVDPDTPCMIVSFRKDSDGSN